MNEGKTTLENQDTKFMEINGKSQKNQIQNFVSWFSKSFLFHNCATPQLRQKCNFNILQFYYIIFDVMESFRTSGPHEKHTLRNITRVTFYVLELYNICAISNAAMKGVHFWLFWMIINCEYKNNSRRKRHLFWSTDPSEALIMDYIEL